MKTAETIEAKKDTRDSLLKQKKFLREFFKDFDVTRASRAVGFKGVSACVSGSRLLRKAKDSGLYAQEAQIALDRAGISLDSVLAELGKLALSNIEDYIRVNDEGQADIDLSIVTRDQLACVQEITVDTTGGSGDGERRKVLRTRFKLADKGSNLERLLKHFGGMAEHHEHTGPNGGPILTAIQVSFITPNANS